MNKIGLTLVVLGAAACSAGDTGGPARPNPPSGSQAQTGAGGGGEGGSAPSGTGGAAATGKGGSGSGTQTGAGGAGSGGTSGAGGSAATTGAGGAVVDAGATVGTIHDLTIGPFTVDPGGEQTFCIDIPLTADGKGYDISRVVADIPPGGHHMILYTNDAATAKRDPYECSIFATLGPNGVLGVKPLFAAQQAHTELNFPDGIAYHFKDKQFITIDFHYLNTTSKAISASGTMHLTEPPVGTVKQHSNIFFFGPVLSLQIPVGEWKNSWYFPLTNTDTELSIFAATTHSHKWTEKATLSFGPEGTTKIDYENTNWDNPELKVYSPSTTVPKDSGVTITCAYNNTTDATLSFGESAATNEMCITWGYYYPEISPGAILDLGK
jgi:hypothetical protein